MYGHVSWTCSSPFGGVISWPRKDTVSGRRCGSQRLRTVSHACRYEDPIVRILTSLEICYSLRYLERNDHKQGARWSERQVGVYHRFGKNEKATMILLHASPETMLQKRLEALFPSQQSTNDHLAHPLMLHVLVLDTYMNNWRWALNDYAQPFRQKVGVLLCKAFRFNPFDRKINSSQRPFSIPRCHFANSKSCAMSSPS